MAGYRSYYQGAIRSGSNGFKLVLGGTGLGKTSGIVETVRKDQSGRKFLYIANRVQLLNEMADRLTAEGIGFVHQKNDPDLLLDLLATEASREEVYALVEDPHVLKCLERINRTAFNPLDTVRLLNTLDRIDEFSGGKQREMAYQVMRFFRELIRKTQQFKVYMESQGSLTRDYDRLTENPTLRKLFPYLAFHQEPDIRMLLTTVQKAYYGIFSGEGNLTLSQLSGVHGNRIIFLDEFDFLENDLIDLICQGGEISEPFKFVEYFFHAMKHNKLPAEDYHISEKRRRQIERIIQRVDQLDTYEFPRKNHFTCTSLDQIRSDLKSTLPSWLRAGEQGIADKDLTICVFQTNRNLVNAPVYFQSTERSLEIVPEPTALSAFHFFDQIHRATVEILRLFQQLSEEDARIHRELLLQCYETTVFKDEVWKVIPTSFLSRVHTTHFGRLLDGGFGCYEIQDLQQETDREEVKFRHYSIPITPEKILLHMVKDNLVFGLSATADISRVLRNFHQDWLQQQMEKENQATWFEPNTSDRRLIRKLNDSKAALRDNRIEVKRALPLDTNRSDHYLIQQLIDYMAVNRPGFGGDNPYARKRASLFFSTLYQIAEQPPRQKGKGDSTVSSSQASTHLLFFSSYRQIEYLFSRHRELESMPFRIRPIEVRDEESRKVFRYFEITLQGEELIVMFYNAAKAREIDREEPVKRMYHQMFWQGKPVVLVTTYPSAGNGINLQYRPSVHGEEETDFGSVHLLDAPYFYFGRVEEHNDENEARQIVKKNLWNLAKLYTAKQMTEGHFKQFLATVRHAHANQWYLRHSDGLLNQLSTFIQALGRIERVWAPMQDQEVHLSEEVWQVFAKVVTEPDFQQLLSERQDFLSYNLAEIFRQVQAAEQFRAQRRGPGFSLQQQEAACKASLGALLNKFEAYRKGKTAGVAETWARLRELALKHEMQDPLLQQFHAVFHSPFSTKGKFYLLKGPELLAPGQQPAHAQPWVPDSLYGRMVQHPVIRRHFVRHNYELGFHNSAGFFFTPYFWHTFLAGAAGEEAVKALLQKEGIFLEEVLPREAFEVADMKLKDLPIYVDVKNYGMATRSAFSLKAGDPGWHPQLHDEAFLQHARKQLRRLHALHKSGVRLLVLNLYGPLDSKLLMLNPDLKEVPWEKARLIIAPAVLGSRNVTAYAHGFERIIAELRNLVASGTV